MGRQGVKIVLTFFFAFILLTGFAYAFSISDLWNSITGNVVDGSISCSPISPSASYSFEDSMTDYSGNSFNGYAAGVYYSDGKFGKAINFAGNINSYATIPAASFNGNDITVSMWVKSDPFVYERSLFSVARDSTKLNEFLFIMRNTSLRTYTRGHFLGDISTKLNDGIWHNLVVTYSATGKVIKVYNNGVYSGGKSDSYNTSLFAKGIVLGQDQDSVLGGFSTAQSFRGSIDELSIYKRVLTETEISNLYNNGIGRAACTTLSSAVPNPPIVAPSCTAFVYSDWSACSNSLQTRSVVSASPSGCSAGNPVVSQSCTMPTQPPTTSPPITTGPTSGSCVYTYSDWSACSAGVQTRTVLSSPPSVCINVPLITIQSCAFTGQTTFPKQIGSYTLLRVATSGPNAGYRCENIEDSPDAEGINLTGEICTNATNLEYRDFSTNKGIFVQLGDIVKGLDIYKKFLELHVTPFQLNNRIVMRLENHELLWFSSGQYDVVFTQEYNATTDSNGVSYHYGYATGDNAVTQKFLADYPVQTGNSDLYDPYLILSDFTDGSGFVRYTEGSVQRGASADMIDVLKDHFPNFIDGSSAKYIVNRTTGNPDIAVAIAEFNSSISYNEFDKSEFVSQFRKAGYSVHYSPIPRSDGLNLEVTRLEDYGVTDGSIIWVSGGELIIISLQDVSSANGINGAAFSSFIDAYRLRHPSTLRNDGSSGNDSCVPTYNCKIDPPICPPNGIQQKLCTNSCTSQPDKEDISCSPGICSGCMLDNKCIPYGYRANVAGVNSYCDISGDFKAQLGKTSDGSWAKCQNNYECNSNLCSGGECVEINDAIKNAKGFKGLFVKALCGLTNLFSADGYNQCLVEYLGDSSSSANSQVSLSVSSSSNEENLRLEKASDKVNLNQSVASVYKSSVGDESLPKFLADGFYDNHYGYVQSIQLSYNNLSVFSDPDYNNAQSTLGFKFDLGDRILNYTFDFTQDAKSSLVGDSLVDFAHTQIRLLGRDYYITEFTKGSDPNYFDHMNLFQIKGSYLLSEKEDLTVSLDAGSKHIISISSITPDKVVLIVDGSKTDGSLSQGGVLKLSNDLYLVVQEIVRSDGVNKVKLGFNSEGVVQIVSGDFVSINNQHIALLKGYLVRGSPVGDEEMLREIIISWTPGNSKVFLTPQQSPIMPVFGPIVLTMSELVDGGEDFGNYSTVSMQTDYSSPLSI